MFRLVTLFFCFAVIAVGCKKTDEGRNTAKNLEAQLKRASQSANRLMVNKRLQLGKIGEAMTTSDMTSMTESEAIQIVQPLIDPSASFLQGYYDINIYEYFAPGSPQIAQIGAMGYRLKQLEEEGKSIDTSQSNGWFLPPAELVSQPNGEILTNATLASIIDCALDALGIPAGLLVGSAKSLSRAALLKAARKLLTRTVGWIGVGIAVYEFGDCMDWW